MTHQEIQEGEIIERYVRRQLAPDERRAFQEHYFACEECFEQAQTLTRFVAGVRQAARKGVLAETATQKRAWWASLSSPLLAVAAALVLAVVFSWLILRQSAKPRQEIAREQQPSATPGQTSTPESGNAPAPAVEKREPPRLQDQRDLLAQNRPPEEAPGKAPTVLLESARDSGASGNQLILPANAKSAILRVETEPGTRFESFHLQLLDAARRPVATVKGVKARASGALAASVPARLLPPGKYLVKLFGVKGEERALIGEYDLNVRQP